MTTTSIINSLKIAAAVVAVAVALFFGYSVAGYVTDNFNIADAALGCSTCSININLDGGGGGGYGGSYSDGGGGGGGGGGYVPPTTPSCALTVPAQTGSYPAQYSLKWVTANATSISINQGIGSVTPVSTGTLSVIPLVTTTYVATVIGAGGTATCSTTITVTPPPTPPQCTLELSKDQISWTTNYANNVQIVPLTNSPQVPGANGGSSPATSVNHTETQAYESLVVQADIAASGINKTTMFATGFKGDQTTMNRVCTLIDGPGATATTFYTEGYNTPNGNYVMQWTGSAWSRVPAINPGMNIHLRYSFTCAKPATSGTYPLSGSHSFVPPLGVGTHTYQLTATGPGGQVQCTKTVIVPPPQEACKLEISKTANKTNVAPGEMVEYTVTFKNKGGTKCTGSGVKVVDVLDTRLTYQSETHSANVTAGYQSDPVYKASDRTLRFNAWDLDPNETGWFKFVAKVGTPSQCSEVIPNKAKITSYEYNNFNTYVESNTVNVSVEKDCTPPPPPGECKLEITKTIDDEDYKSFGATSVGPNEYVQYTIEFKNAGSKKCTGSGVKVRDVLDSRLTYISETHSLNVTAGYQSEPVYNSSTRTVSFNAWDLDPNESGWVKIKTKTATPAQCSEVIPNKAKITSYEYNNFNTWVYSNVADVTLKKDCTPPATPACTLTASPYEIAPGGSSTLSWTTTNATSISIDNGIGSVTPVVAGTKVVTPAMTTTYTATATGPGGTVTCTKKIKVVTPPGECKLEIEKSADKTHAAPNDVIEYTISVKNVGGKKCTGSGVKLIDILDSRLTYQSETHSANITAGYQSDPVYKSSTRTLSWNAWDLEPGEEGWVTFKAKAVTPSACTETAPNKAKITAYEYNNFNTWVESNVVNVTIAKDCNIPAPYCTMSASPTGIEQGQSSTLTWNSSNVTSVSIDQGVGSVGLSGSQSVSPTTSTTYSGTFTGPGGTVTCTASVGVQPIEIVPQCTLTASASTIKTGESVIVSWTSMNVSQGFITNIGTTTPVATGSSESFPSDSTTYVGTFTGSYGTVTCSVPVTVTKGPGGCTSNCGGGGLNQPNVVMLQKPPEAPLAFVTLDQIPYTGFAAGKALTLAFWLAVGLLAAVTTYFVMGRGGMQFVLGNALGAVGFGEYEDLETERRVSTLRVPSPFQGQDSAAYSNGSSSRTRPNDNGYSASVSAPVAVAAPVARPAVDGIPELGDVIESRAHGAGVLMSPEAVAMTLRLSKDRGQILQIFGDILNEAIKTLPREDGWIMLTSERFESLTMSTPVPTPVATVTSTPSVESILSSVMSAPVAPAKPTVNVELPMTNRDDQEVVMALARAILGGNRDVAYATVRNLETAGANATTVMTIIAGAFDQLHRARRHGLTTELSVLGMPVSDEALAKMVEVFAHGMDHGYSNAFVGLKLAVAQSFEARG